MDIIRASLMSESLTGDLHTQMCTQLLGSFMSYVLKL